MLSLTKSADSNQYLVDDYFLATLTKLNQEEIATYKRLHKVDINMQQELLKAAYELLKKCNQGPYVKNVLTESVSYSGIDGDGFSLANDIANLLKLEEVR